ncbi:putative nicotinate-nucleotide adenylyltransferase [Cellvibrio zantedeschiae]|uniref:Probable nicotinate-nucleotide adenylyltransferase n=1 Tax=Cellvibrio zantedeschiae TaxID=1237077 RepID=A0ABQ3AM63_9GAMM|nr:nicotinate-nucleotide adenylyltransferase [Cellvibrio zantedeschiae]GGY61701.1 putative nicotinate-nucleotide adenylyltransferase [Cellvibrio zantedeschiae]
MRKKIGIFGGTFDPIHIGHLRLALELKQQLNLDEMRLLPCHQPPHRDVPQANSAQRAEMLRIAVKTCPELQLDERELQRDKPSYTYDTLQDFRAELGVDVSLVLCMGEDAFTGLSTWHRWQEIIQLAHIVVIARPGWNIPETGEVRELLNRHQGLPTDLVNSPAGAIVLQSPRLLPISATEIREQINREQSAQFLVPDAVWDYIKASKLYR